jgi:hypothetical protein
VERPSKTLPVRDAIAVLGERFFEGALPVVTDVAIQGDSASVSYVYFLDKSVAFASLSAQLKRRGGRWLVTYDSMCHLATLTEAVSDC